MSNNELTVIPQSERAVIDAPLSAKEVTAQVQLIQQVMQTVMKDGEHYGTVPGCGEKKVLLKAGAEKLSLTFRLTPRFDIQVNNLAGGHKEWQIVCAIYSASGQFMGEGVGAGSTMEGKYRFKNAGRKCPSCGKETIIKGRTEYGGGWLCYAKKGGCGAKFADGDQSIEGQDSGRVEHDNPADFYNTCLKMAKKRAHIDAILTVTAASDIFTQDLDENVDTVQHENGNQTIDTPQTVTRRPAPGPQAPPPDPAANGESIRDKNMMAFGSWACAESSMFKGRKHESLSIEEIIAYIESFNGDKLMVSHVEALKQYAAWKRENQQ